MGIVAPLKVLLYMACGLHFHEVQRNSCLCRVSQREYQGFSRHDVQQMLWREVSEGG